MTAEQYVDTIVRNVKCPKKKRMEIKQQLLSDISAAMENGESLDEIKRRMGSAKEAAEEFNQNLSAEERKSYSRHKIIKIIGGIVLVLMILICLAYWLLPKSREIGSSGVFEQGEVEKQVKQVVELLDNSDYDALQEESTDALKAALTAENIEPAKAQIGADWGERQLFGNIYMVEVKQQGKFAVVTQMTVTYENASVTYTITFDENMKLAGLYMK